jgi:stress response protein YsnF
VPRLLQSSIRTWARIETTSQASTANRVKEEVVINKDVQQRNQKVSDTVRRTEVEVEDERTKRGAGTTPRR